jgi:hypothetical protein
MWMTIEGKHLPLMELLSCYFEVKARSAITNYITSILIYLYLYLYLYYY